MTISLPISETHPPTGLPPGPAAGDLRPWIITPTLSEWRADLNVWVHVDPHQSRTWHLSAPMHALLITLVDGWTPLSHLQPGALASASDWPEPLRTALAKIDPSEHTWSEHVDTGLTELLAAGILVPVAASNVLAGEHGHTAAAPWYHRQYHAGTIPALPHTLRGPLRRILPFFLVTALALWVLVLIRLSQDSATGLLGPAADWLRTMPASPAGLWGWTLWIFFARMLLHELGHAVAAGIVTGRPTEIGIRLASGIPGAYADVAAISLLPHQRDRIAVILAGMAIDSLLALGLVVWLVEAGQLPVPLGIALRTIFPVVVLWNALPFARTDGYFLLAELTKNATLRDDAFQDLQRAVQGDLDGWSPDSHRIPVEAADWIGARRSWRAWFALLTLILRGLVVGVIALGLGTWLKIPPPWQAWLPLSIPLGVCIVTALGVRQSPNWAFRTLRSNTLHSSG